MNRLLLTREKQSFFSRLKHGNKYIFIGEDNCPKWICIDFNINAKRPILIASSACGSELIGRREKHCGRRSLTFIEGGEVVCWVYLDTRDDTIEAGSDWRGWRVNEKCLIVNRSLSMDCGAFRFFYPASVDPFVLELHTSDSFDVRIAIALSFFWLSRWTWASS